MESEFSSVFALFLCFLLWDHDYCKILELLPSALPGYLCGVLYWVLCQMKMQAQKVSNI